MVNEVPRLNIYLLLTMTIFRLTIAQSPSDNMFNSASYDHEGPIVSAIQQYENSFPYSPILNKHPIYHGLVNTMLRQRPTRGYDIEAICRKGIAFGSWLKDFCKTKRFQSG